jgi:hypothetical protein
VYAIKSFKGNAGAILFLFDQNQPNSVETIDHGKAIAVHAGAHPILLNRHLALKL